MLRSHPWVLLVAWLLGIAGVRFFLSATYPSYIGIDGGAYLQDVLQYWYHIAPIAEEVHFERPPLAPGFILAFFLWAWGLTPLAYNLYAAFGSMLLFPGYYLLAQRILGHKWAVLAVVAASLDWQQWIMFVTGVVPVLGFGGICMAMWAMIGISDENKLRHRLALLAVVPLIALSNQTSAGLALVSLSVAWLVLPNKIRVGAWLFSAGLVAIAVAWPWYINVLPGSEQVRYPGSFFYLPPITEYVWWQTPAFLAIAGFAILNSLGVGIVRYTASRPILVVSVVVVVHTLLCLVSSSDESVMNILFRSGIWVPLPLWIVAAWVVKQLKPSKTQLGTLVAMGIILASIGVGYVYQRQYFYSGYYSADVKDAVESLDMDTVTRIGTNAESRGFWLAALTGKPVVWIQPALPSPRYVESELQARCELGWLPDCHEGFVSHWIIDKTHRQNVIVEITRAANPQEPWSHIGQDAPWLSLVWSQGEVEVWEYR